MRSFASQTRPARILLTLILLTLIALAALTLNPARAEYPLSDEPITSGPGAHILLAASEDGSRVIYNFWPYRRPGELTGAIEARLIDRATGVTRPIAASPDGQWSRIVATAVSSNGRYVALLSTSRLTDDAPDGGGLAIYLHDIDDEQLAFIAAADDSFPSGVTSISDDGLLLAGRDRNYHPAMLDTGTGAITSITSASLASIADSRGPMIAGDGSTLVATLTDAPNLDASDTNGEPDVYAFDLPTGDAELISVTRSGRAGDAGAWDALVSADGSVVVFSSAASDMTDLPCVPRDGGGCAGQIYARDRARGRTDLVTAGPGGVPSEAGGSGASISRDGRFVAFVSRSSTIDPMNLVLSPLAGRPHVRDRARGITLPLQSLSHKAMPFMDVRAHALSGDGRSFYYTAATVLSGRTLSIYASSVPLA